MLEFNGCSAGKDRYPGPSRLSAYEVLSLDDEALLVNRDGDKRVDYF